MTEMEREKVSWVSRRRGGWSSWCPLVAGLGTSLTVATTARADDYGDLFRKGGASPPPTPSAPVAPPTPQKSAAAPTPTTPTSPPSGGGTGGEASSQPDLQGDFVAPRGALELWLQPVLLTPPVGDVSALVGLGGGGEVGGGVRLARHFRPYVSFAYLLFAPGTSEVTPAVGDNVSRTGQSIMSGMQFLVGGPVNYAAFDLALGKRWVTIEREQDAGSPLNRTTVTSREEYSGPAFRAGVAWHGGARFVWPEFGAAFTLFELGEVSRSTRVGGAGETTTTGTRNDAGINFSVTAVVSLGFSIPFTDD